MFVNDAGTLRRVRAAYVNDAGTLRRIRQFYVNSGGVLRREAFSLLVATLVEGSIGDETDGAFGFNLNDPIGSLTPDTFGPLQVVALHDFIGSGISDTVLAITGFSADPGQGWLGQLSVDGITRTGASADLYESIGGESRWHWTGDIFGFDGSGTRAVIIS